MTTITMQRKGILQGLVLSLFFLSIPLACQEDDDEPVSKQPRITSITPAQGVVGTEVTIAGENFGTSITANTVRFNGVVAVVNAATATQLKATVPVNATTGLVSLTVNGVTVNGPQFQVVTPVYPSLTEATIPDVHPGSYLTLAGTGFTSTNVDDYEVGTTTATSLLFETIEVGTNFIKVRVPLDFSVGTYEVGLFYRDELMEGRLDVTVRNPSLTASPEGGIYAGEQFAVSIDMVLSDDPEDYEVQMASGGRVVDQVTVGESTTTLVITCPANLPADLYNVFVIHEAYPMQTQVEVLPGPGDYDFIYDQDRESIMSDQFDNSTANQWLLLGAQISGGKLQYFDDAVLSPGAYLNQAIGLDQNYQVEFYKEGAGSFTARFKGMEIRQESSGVLYLSGNGNSTELPVSQTGKFTIRKVEGQVYWFVNETLIFISEDWTSGSSYFFEFFPGHSNTMSTVQIDWVAADYIH